MTAAPAGPRRGVVVAAVVAVLVLAVGSATLIVGVVNARTERRNHAFGAVSCTVPQLPGTTVDVTLSDAGNAGMGGVGGMGGNGLMGGRPMMVTLRAQPATVAAGQVSFVVDNRGDLAHEMVVLPLPADGPGTRPTGPDGRIDESQSLGEASSSCSGEPGDGIAPGSVSWTTLTLTPGRYELVCNEPWHYAAGMFDVLTVT